MPDLKPQYGHSSDEKVHNVPTIITGAESSQISFNCYERCFHQELNMFNLYDVVAKFVIIILFFFLHLDILISLLDRCSELISRTIASDAKKIVIVCLIWSIV